MESFKIDPYLVNGQHRITINIVGAGGTGSLIVTKLARLHQAMIRLDHPGLFVTLIDNDIVEEHNVGRQMFTDGDVGSYKADVLISKINHAFGMDWNSVHKKYDPKTHKNVNILISAVDNVPARKQIIQSFLDQATNNSLDTEKRFYLIDCGNARDYGQVILTDVEMTLKYIGNVIPDWHLQDTEEIQGPSCSYLESLQQQDLFINDWASLFAVGFIKELWMNKQIDYQAVFFNAAECEIVKMKIDGDKKRRQAGAELVDQGH